MDKVRQSSKRSHTCGHGLWLNKESTTGKHNEKKMMRNNQALWKILISVAPIFKAKPQEASQIPSFQPNTNPKNMRTTQTKTQNLYTKLAKHKSKNIKNPNKNSKPSYQKKNKTAPPPAGSTEADFLKTGRDERHDPGASDLPKSCTHLEDGSVEQNGGSSRIPGVVVSLEVYTYIPGLSSFFSILHHMTDLAALR